jgi:6-phosphofructokinase 1
VINESLVGAVLEAANHDGIGRVYGAVHGLKGLLEGDLVDLSAESPERLEAVSRTPSAALGSVRKKATADDCKALIEIFRAHDIRYFFYIGGNDSAETAHIINEQARDVDYEFRVCHIPKTIDNDLLVTDHCPGYGSAARFVALALMGDNLDNRALRGVKIDIIMGRHAGFLTAAAALARQDEDDGPHLVYVPEAPFEEGRFCDDIRRCLDKWGRCVIAASEGIAREDGTPVFTSGEKDSHGNVQLSGTGALGDYLTKTVKDRIPSATRVRADTLGYMQRCFPSIRSEVDAQEARAAGVYAVREMASGDHTSGSVAIRRTDTQGEYGFELFITDLKNVAKHTRSLPKEYIASSGSDVTQAFVDYASPLIGELPTLGRLEMARVSGAT